MLARLVWWRSPKAALKTFFDHIYKASFLLTNSCIDESPLCPEIARNGSCLMADAQSSFFSLVENLIMCRYCQYAKHCQL